MTKYRGHKPTFTVIDDMSEWRSWEEEERKWRMSRLEERFESSGKIIAIQSAIMNELTNATCNKCLNIDSCNSVDSVCSEYHPNVRLQNMMRSTSRMINERVVMRGGISVELAFYELSKHV